MKEKETLWDVVVVGGGPAGMMAAGIASARGRRVLLLEKNPSLGKKLLMTGGGRCNVTNNITDIRTLLAKYKESDKFLFSAFSQFAVPETLDFFHAKGVETKVEGVGRVFPISNKAESVWRVLVDCMKKGGVTVETKARVGGISFNSEGHYFVINAGKKVIKATSCVVATGGTSRPETGSTGEGFGWLKKLGHTIFENNLALVPISLHDSWVKKVAGVTLPDIKLTTFLNGVKQKVYKGRLLFTHVGVSGPTVLNMSREVGELLYGAEGTEYDTPQGASGKKEVTIMLDMFPGLDNKALREKLQTVLVSESNKKIKNSLGAFMPTALVESVLFLAGINGETPNHSVRTEERKQLVLLLKNIPLHVSGLLGKDKAIVSSGGVSLSEVDFKTMQSRVVPGLYLVGDVLNIDRPSGGYSLQLCWTTGFVAGNNC